MEKSEYAFCLQKNNGRDLKNYHPISLLLVSGKIFETLFYKFFTIHVFHQ